MFELKEHRKNIPEEKLLEDVKRVAELLKTKNLTYRQYLEHGRFSTNTLARKLGKWSEILEKAGLQAKFSMNNPNEELFENIAEVWTKLGRQPRYRDMTKDISQFSAKTYQSRFGTWNDALRAFINFIEGNKDIVQVEIKQSVKNKKRTPRDINWRLRAKVLIRNNCICQMCGTSPAKDPDVILHVDHIHPWSKGGETVEENLRTLCHKCNIGKNDMVIEKI